MHLAILSPVILQTNPSSGRLASARSLTGATRQRSPLHHAIRS